MEIFGIYTKISRENKILIIQLAGGHTEVTYSINKHYETNQRQTKVISMTTITLVCIYGQSAIKSKYTLKG